MSNTTQYTYGVIGAFESSTTMAIDLVPVGAEAQEIGGETACVPAHVNRSGITLPGNALSDTLIVAGAVMVTPAEKIPHPASGALKASAATAAAARLPGLRRPAVPSASRLTAQSLGPDGGCGGPYRPASTPRDGSPGAENRPGGKQEHDPERLRLTLAALPLREALRSWADNSNKRARSPRRPSRSR